MNESLVSNRCNKSSRILSFLLVFLVAFVPMTVYFPTNVHAATTLNVYPAPTGVPLNTYYTVKVREPGGVWQDLDEYMTWVNGYSGQTASFVYFDTDGPVELSVTNNNGSITSANIRPSNNNITPTINGNTMTFTISGPMKLSAVVNGDVNNTVDIFANPLEVNPPSPTDPNVIYLGPGYYNQDYVVPSGKTLYIAGGAVVKGSVIMDNATNAKVIGRGVLDRPSNRGVSADHANQITIDGIIVNNFADGNNGGNGISLGSATNVTVNNFKSYSRKRWSDGIDTFSASNISFNDLFMRNGDDAVAIYGSRFNGGMTWTGNLSKNISVTNSILFPDVAHPINIGTHGDPTSPGGGDTIDNISFKNIDIFGNYTRHPISLTSSDGNLVTNATFEDIRIEGNSVAQIMEILTYKNAGFSTATGRGINNVLFKNVTYNGSIANQTQIKGQDSTRMTQNVTFENLVVNGNVVTSASGGNFNIGSYTSNINFIASGGSVPAPTPIPPYTLTNLALNKSASAGSTQSGHSSSLGNDGSTTTRWTANDGNTGHWWKVDLGSSMNITGGTQVMWEMSGKVYKYKIETSNDNTNWTLQVDKTGNTSTDQVQNDVFYDTARYIRITVTGLESGAWASIYDFKVLGNPTNLALGRSSSADSTQSGNPVSNGNDGNAATLWRANDANTGHWWKVDLGASKNIAYGTQVMWPTSGAAYQYKVETSTDNTNWTVKVDKTGNTDTSQVINDYFTGTARYVRITVTGLPSGVNAGFWDFKVLGDPTNLALNRTVSTDSEQAGNPASSGNDGSTTTRWSANDGNTGHWWTVDLGAVKNITGGTQVMWEKLGEVYKYRIEISDDNTNWTEKVNKTSNNRTDQVQSDYFTGTARYVRITVTGLPSGANASFYEFKVFGTVDGSTVFNDVNYGGTGVTLGAGFYTLAQMQAEGIADNSISSMQVPAGYTVIAYDGEAFDGTSWTYTSDNSNMVNTGNNDQISSIKVLSAGPTFYSNTSYGGTAVTLGAGEYTLAQLQAAGIANNSISSIRVPVGYTVVAYDGSAFDGTSWTFTTDNSNLVNSGNNDMISSVKITIN